MRIIAILFVFVCACATEQTAPISYRDPVLRIVGVPSHETLNKKSILHLEHDGDIAGCWAERSPTKIQTWFDKDSTYLLQPFVSAVGCDSVLDFPGSTMPESYDSVSMLAYSEVTVFAKGKNGTVVSDKVRLPIHAAEDISCADITLTPTRVKNDRSTSMTLSAKRAMFGAQNKSAYRGVGASFDNSRFVSIAFHAPDTVTFGFTTFTPGGLWQDLPTPIFVKIFGIGGITCPFSITIEADSGK